MATYMTIETRKITLGTKEWADSNVNSLSLLWSLCCSHVLINFFIVNFFYR